VARLDLVMQALLELAQVGAAGLQCPVEPPHDVAGAGPQGGGGHQALPDDPLQRFGRLESGRAERLAD